MSDFRTTAIKEGWADELTETINDTGAKKLAENEDKLRKEFEARP